MLRNRSMPTSAIIPVLSYSDVEKASLWLCKAFGFELRLKVGGHRAQLGFGDGAVVVAERATDTTQPMQRGMPFSLMVRVEDVDAHHRSAARYGATILSTPESHPYGERQYSCRDLAGYCWTFSQSIADIAPEAWGGIAVNDYTA